MKKNILLSAVVSVFNGEKELDDCLKSASFADEIIVVNNSSTDRTEEIALKYTKKIFTQPNNLMLNINKNLGFSKATGEWILSLDADERITPDLKTEIESRIKNQESRIDGYFIPRKNIIFGKWIEHTGWYPDHQLRLFKNGKGKFPEKHVHEMVKVDGEAGYLQNHIIHYNYNTISQFLQKLGDIYAPNEAEQLLKKSYIFDWKDGIRFPVKEFLSRFFAREGYKDGFHGLMLSFLMAFYHLIVFANIWEKRNFEKIEIKDILGETETEFRKSNKELLFWMKNEKVNRIKNPIKKTAYRFLRKLG